MRRYLIALVCLIAALAAAPQAMAERRVALVVGNAQYVHTQPLPNPRNDAEDVAAALRRLGFEVTVGYDLDQSGFAGTIDTFARALDGADVGLFFYAGHGLQISDRNYLVSTGARLDSTFLVPAETIELDAIVRLMESKTATNLIFLDACRNNPLAENLKRSLATVSRSAALGRGLARVEPSGRDTLIAFSAAPGQEAADGRSRNSPFTASLLKHISQPGLEVSVMLKDVAADVREETRNAQRPQQVSDMTKSFYFARADSAVVSAPVTVPAPPPPAPAALAPSSVDPVDLAFWQAVSASNECESIRAYTRRFPNGSFVDLAAISERRLCAKEAAPIAVNPAAAVTLDAAAPSSKAGQRPAPPVPPVAATSTAPKPAARRHLTSRTSDKKPPSRPQRAAVYEAEPVEVAPRVPIGISFGLGRMMRFR
jgi:caspase domain-containing protein